MITWNILVPSNAIRSWWITMMKLLPTQKKVWFFFSHFYFFLLSLSLSISRNRFFEFFPQFLFLWISSPFENHKIKFFPLAQLLNATTQKKLSNIFISFFLSKFLLFSNFIYLLLCDEKLKTKIKNNYLAQKKFFGIIKLKKNWVWLWKFFICSF